MTVITQIDLYMALRGKIGEPEAKMLTEYVDQKAVETFDKGKDILATKDNLNTAKQELKEEMHLLREDMANMKSQLLMWMFGLFVPFYIGMIVFLIKQFI